MSRYNLTELNDCDNVTGFTDSNKSPSLNTTVGQRYEGSGSIETQHTNTAGGDELDTTQTSGGGGTFSINMSDRTYYAQLKDNLVDTYANQGIMAVFGDGTNKVGFQMAGNNAIGMPVSPFYNIYKFDCSNLPSGSNTTFTGTEGSLSFSAITAMGIGTVHLAKAVGNVANIFCDRLAYISNDSYALSINGGTSGTPETMSDVAGDDITNGWGLISNPLGDQYILFGPTEWGESVSPYADCYFTASGEQWFLMGDNSGGHSVGVTHFPFRVIGNSGTTNSFVINNIVIVNTGTLAEFDLSDTNVDTLEIDSCSLTNLGAIEAPSSGGTSRFLTNTIFSNCGIITHNGADLDGCTIQGFEGTANTSALIYNINADPDGEMDNMTFTKGTAATHAIEFGTNVPTTMTLRNCIFSGYNASDGQNDSTFHFKDASPTSITLNLIGCTGNFTFRTDGADITLVADPATTLVTVRDNNKNLLQGARVILKANGSPGALPYKETVTITRSGNTASVSHTAHGLSNGQKVEIKGANEYQYNGAKTISNVTTNAYDFNIDSPLPTSPATGTITATAIILEGTTDSSGQISDSRVYSAAQPVEGRVSNGTQSPYFKDFPLNDTVDDTNGLSISVQLILDE
jgi:hypothetical protein